MHPASSAPRPSAVFVLFAVALSLVLAAPGATRGMRAGPSGSPMGGAAESPARDDRGSASGAMPQPEMTEAPAPLASSVKPIAKRVLKAGRYQGVRFDSRRRIVGTKTRRIWKSAVIPIVDVKTVGRTRYLRVASGIWGGYWLRESSFLPSGVRTAGAMAAPRWPVTTRPEPTPTATPEASASPAAPSSATPAPTPSPSPPAAPWESPPASPTPPASPRRRVACLHGGTEPLGVRGPDRNPAGNTVADANTVTNPHAGRDASLHAGADGHARRRAGRAPADVEDAGARLPHRGPHLQRWRGVPGFHLINHRQRAAGRHERSRQHASHGAGVVRRRGRGLVHGPAGPAPADNRHGVRRRLLGEPRQRPRRHRHVCARRDVRLGPRPLEELERAGPDGAGPGLGHDPSPGSMGQRRRLHDGVHPAGDVVVERRHPVRGVRPRVAAPGGPLLPGVRVSHHPEPGRRRRVRVHRRLVGHLGSLALRPDDGSGGRLRPARSSASRPPSGASASRRSRRCEPPRPPVSQPRRDRSALYSRKRRPQRARRARDLRQGGRHGGDRCAVC